jgi:hypothetical protein
MSTVAPLRPLPGAALPAVARALAAIAIAALVAPLAEAGGGPPPPAGDHGRVLRLLPPEPRRLRHRPGWNRRALRKRRAGSHPGEPGKFPGNLERRGRRRPGHRASGQSFRRRHRAHGHCQRRLRGPGHADRRRASRSRSCRATATRRPSPRGALHRGRPRRASGASDRSLPARVGRELRPGSRALDVAVHHPTGAGRTLVRSSQEQ